MGYDNDMFLPIEDTFLSENNRYLPFNIEDRLRDGKFPQVPILTGVGQPITEFRYSMYIKYTVQSV